MSKKLKRSAIALVLAATMVLSSQGVLTVFAADGDIETEASVSSALEQSLDEEKPDVSDESDNVDGTEIPEDEVCEECQGTNGNHAETCPHYVDPTTSPEESGEDETNNGQAQQECTCGVGEGQPHQEGCPLYEEPAAPECTCGAEEGQPHQEDCPLYVESAEETQEPSEEDAAAVQAVVEQINALPEASTLGPETIDVEALSAQVKAAREAYDKLTDAQKALVEQAVLDKLVALEGALEGLQQVNTIPGAVAQIGETPYETLDAAIKDAADGATIEVLTNCTTTGMNLDKNLTIKGAAGVNPEITFENYGIALWGKALTFQDCKVTMNGIGSTPYTAEWKWMTICASVNASLTLDNVEMTMDASGTTNSPHAIYFCENNELNILNGSKLTISNYSQDALEWDGSKPGYSDFDTGYNVTIENSTYVSNRNRSGFTGTFTVKATNSTVEVINSTGNGSNGSHFEFIDCNESNGKYVNFSDNGSHGLSAGTLTIDNSTVTANNNKGMGITVNNEFEVTDNSVITVTGNASNTSYGYAAVRLYNDFDFLVDSTSKLYIKDNNNTGLYVRQGNLAVQDGAVLEITGNKVTHNLLDGYGGGIYVGYGDNYDPTVVLPADAKICNNHALVGGDDIYVSEGVDGPSLTFGKVGDWVLDDCDHAITGWFDDSEGSRWNVHTGPVHAELYDFEDATTTVSGALALKAAHPYQYDPEAPTEPSDPVKWGTSKSKTATNLDANYESQVTLSLPAAETVPVTDVVFVLDRSSSAGAARQEISDMMDNLLQIVNNSDAVINVGVVNFWYKADSGIALTALTNESIDSIKNAIMEGNLSGTNIEAGIDAAVAMLDASSTPDENKYMVLVTDGISHAWNDSNGQPMATWGEGNADGTVIHGGTSPYIYFDTDKPNFDEVYRTSPSDEKLSDIYDVPVFDDKGNELTSSDIGDKYIRMDEYSKYYTSVEKGIYKAAHSYAEAASKYKCINLYWNVSDDYLLATQFMAWTGTQGKCYNISDDLSGAFEEVEREITYVVDAGSQVIDVIGGDDDGVKYDYDFDFVDVISLTVGGEELDFTKEGNTYYFGDSIDGTYPFVLTYYPNGLGVATMSIEDEQVIAGELFVWEINVPITIDKSVQLTYTVKLSNPKTVDGTYGQYDADGSKNYDGLYTNNSAVLFPVDSNGNVGEKEAFDKPTVSYTVSNGKPVNPPENPDPTPDPDRPSRPSRDDDDWEPLPNVPVKDKPQKAETENKVPVETETPAPEQPDKYNPETGDTTTVFAAMALAAVSLGGVVLLGRKKK